MPSKSLKEKQFTVKFQMGGYKVRVVITNDVWASRNHRNRAIGRKVQNSTGYALCSIVDGKGLSYLFLPEKCEHEIAAHEAVHAIYHMYDWLGIEEDDSEVFAYQLEYLLRGIFRRL